MEAQLNTPFFYFGRIKHQTQQAQFQAQEQFQNYNKIVFEALLEIQQNMDSDALIEKQLSAQHQVSEQSERALEIAHREYNDGLTDLSTLDDPSVLSLTLSVNSLAIW